MSKMMVVTSQHQEVAGIVQKQVTQLLKEKAKNTTKDKTEYCMDPVRDISNPKTNIPKKTSQPKLTIDTWFADLNVLPSNLPQKCCSCNTILQKFPTNFDQS